MRSTLRTGMTLAVLLLLFLAFNLVWLGKLPDIRWDVSQQQTHTPSPPARQLLASLEHPVDLYYFNASDAPNRSHALRRYGKHIEDLLGEYEKAAKGMLNLHIIDPAPFSEDAYKAQLYGLDHQAGFLGLIGTRAGLGAQRIEAFSLDREPLLEYEISHLIHKLQHPKPTVVGLLSGLAMDESASGLLKTLQPHFTLVNLGVATGRVPERVQTLIVVQPRALPEQTLYGIEQFVLRGGRLMMFIDPVSEQGPNATPANARLDELLAAWGVQMPEDKLLVDPLYASSVTPEPGKPGIFHPARLNLPRDAMNPHDISSWKLNRVTLSSSGALLPLKNSRTHLTPLLQSSRQSVLLDTDRFASATEFGSLIDASSTQAQPHVIAARIEGPARSIFPDGIKGQPGGLQKATQIQVVVVADTDMLTDQVAGSAPNGNMLFILNTLDNLTAPDALASVRPRTPTRKLPNRLSEMRDNAARAYRDEAAELERRLQQTEQEWQLLSPSTLGVVSQTVDTSSQLQALNKERLRLPIELHALKVEAYAQVNRLELAIKLLLIFTIPLMLCLIAWGIYLRQHRRYSRAGTVYH